jgi:hypothetical protein
MTSEEEFQTNFIELSADSADIAIELITGSELLKDIPVVGIFYKVGKTLKSLPDAIFLHKVSKFLATANQKVSLEERINFSEELKKDKTKRDRLYTAIFIKIDKFDDITKADIFAKIFSCFIKNKIDYETFQSLSSALNLAELELLMQFSHSCLQLGSSGYYGNLLGTKFVTLNLDRKIRHSNETNVRTDYSIQYSITELGRLFAYISEDLEEYFRPLNEKEREIPMNWNSRYSFEVPWRNIELHEKLKQKFSADSW